jgi:putative DNA primase/helicase
MIDDTPHTLDEIKATLADNAEALAVDLFGKPTRRTGAILYFGKKYSTLVNISGKYQGRFRSWETDESGSMLDAIIFAYSCSFKDAIDHAKGWLGIADDNPLPRRKPIARPVVDVDTDEIAREKQARQIWDASKPVYGTPGEVYLKGRAINASEWPETVRWNNSGFLVVASTVKNKITQVQRIYINADGTPKLDDDGRKIKRTRGPSHGGSVRFDGKDGPLHLAEGPETGLSVWHSTGYETWVSLGSIRADLSDVSLDRTIIICKDDDAKKAPSRKALRDRVRQWRREGRTVHERLPFELSRRNKMDFNDALKEYGPDYVRQRLTPSNVIPLPSTLTLADARKQTARKTRESIEELAQWDGEGDQPVHCLKVGLGIGKTEEAIKHTIKWVKEGRGSVVYAVPSHNLSSDLLARFNDAAGNVSVAVWKGRAWKPKDDSAPMCQNIDVVKEVQRITGDPQETVCRKELENGSVQKCPYYDGCLYQAQRQQQADIWITAHHSLFSDKPEAIDKPSLLVIDESFYQAGLRGLDGHHSVISIDQINASTLHGRTDMGFSADLDATLGVARRLLGQAITSLDTGPLPSETLVSLGLTSEDCISASKAEWMRKVHVNIYPGMPDAAFKDAIKKASINAELARMSRLWKELANLIDGPHELSGRISIEYQEDKKNKTSYRVLRMKGIDNIKEGWIAPTLHIDATMRMDLIRAYFPQAKLKADISAETPHQKVTQYYDKTFSKWFLNDNAKQIDKLWSKAKAMAISKGGNWLVVMQKSIEDQIRERYKIPSFIDLAHHNNVAGIDRWRDVSGIIVIGRTQPPPGGPESIVGALTGGHIPPIDI